MLTRGSLKKGDDVKVCRAYFWCGFLGLPFLWGMVWLYFRAFLETNEKEGSLSPSIINETHEAAVHTSEESSASEQLLHRRGKAREKEVMVQKMVPARCRSEVDRIVNGSTALLSPTPRAPVLVDDEVPPPTSETENGPHRGKENENDGVTSRGVSSTVHNEMLHSSTTSFTVAPLPLFPNSLPPPVSSSPIKEGEAESTHSISCYVVVFSEEGERNEEAEATAVLAATKKGEEKEASEARRVQKTKRTANAVVVPSTAISLHPEAEAKRQAQLRWYVDTSRNLFLLSVIVFILLNVVCYAALPASSPLWGDEAVIVWLRAYSRVGMG